MRTKNGEKTMIYFYFWTTPNGYKPLLLLEEAAIPYEIYPVNISQGEQFEPVFSRISPNNKIPAIFDLDRDVAIFESGAILLYLAEKYDAFIPKRARDRARVLQWLFWQVGGVGPIFGQNLHFGQYASEHIPYANDRFVNETIIDSRNIFTNISFAPYPAPLRRSRQGPAADQCRHRRDRYRQLGCL